jgi:hypothetical protein
LISDIETFEGEPYDLSDRIEGAGYTCRGMDFTRPGYSLTVFERGPWLVRIKKFATTYEVAAFNQEGFLCPLEEAL